MGERYKTCDLHRKVFPNNQVDTYKTKMYKLSVEDKAEIEGESVKLNLFADAKAENKGLDVCESCLTELILDATKTTGNTPAWLSIEWEKKTYQKKDGSGSYTRNEPKIMSIDEVTAEIRASKQAQQPPTPSAK